MSWTKILQLTGFLLWPILLFGLYALVKNREEVARRLKKYSKKNQD